MMNIWLILAILALLYTTCFVIKKEFFEVNTPKDTENSNIKYTTEDISKAVCATVSKLKVLHKTQKVSVIGLKKVKVTYNMFHFFIHIYDYNTFIPSFYEVKVKRPFAAKHNYEVSYLENVHKNTTVSELELKHESMGIQSIVTTPDFHNVQNN